ncbi:MAG: polysaccharide biosynthesis protein PslH, partial [Actinomycetota bacterium]|nr:polysaccharide biosynthesis protein PslH [Actinomycetota bacterium]
TGGPPDTARHSEGVEIVGRVDSIPAFLAGVAVVAVPVIKGPGTPVKFAEALASGAAVAATTDAAEGCPDAPANTSNDPAELAAAIAHLLNHPEEAQQRGAETRAYALARCPWSVTQQPLVNWVLTGSFES